MVDLCQSPELGPVRDDPRLPEVFASVIACTLCQPPNVLRDAYQNVPQPGFIGERYKDNRVLLVGQNPALPPRGLLERDRAYTAALRTLCSDPTSHRFTELHQLLAGYVPTWLIHKGYFRLDEWGLDLEDIAYCNLVRCRTAANAQPKKGRTNDPGPVTRCVDTHFARWLDLLAPACVVFLGVWAWEHGANACHARGIPSQAIDRNRSLTSEYRHRNRAEVAEFVRKCLHT